MLLQVGDSDPAQSEYWSVCESFVSFVLTNLPVVYPLIRGVVEKGRTSLSKSMDGASGPKSGMASNNNNGAYRLDSYPGHKRRDLESASKEKIVSHYGDKTAAYCGTRHEGSLDDQASQNSDNIVCVESTSEEPLQCQPLGHRVSAGTWQV